MRYLVLLLTLLTNTVYSQEIGDMLLVKWEDHYSIDEWQEIPTSEDIETLYVTTVGVFLAENKTYIVLARNYTSDELVDGLMFILKKNIVYFYIF